MEFNKTRVGMTIDEIETPALLIDLDAMEANLAAMSEFFSKLPAKLRPHAKTHKCPAIAHKQLDAGAIGITCAKVSEAEVMINAGIKDVLIANQVVQKSKIERLVGLSRHSNAIVACDSPENARDLSAAARAFGARLNVIIEVDVGMTRAGTRSAAESVALARLLSSLPGLQFRGMMGYEGHTQFIEDAEERKRAIHEANAVLVSHRDAVQNDGIAVEIVSAGGTGSHDTAGVYPGITEIEAGSYVFMDARYNPIQGAKFKPALTLLSTVVSRPSKNRAVLDAGLKAITKEFGTPPIKDVEGAEIVHLSEEHAKVELSDASRDLRAGDKVQIIPSHGCTTINLHDKYYGIRNGVVEVVWDIAARGAFV